MAWGEAAAEQHEKDQPSTCLRPDGAGPELPPLEGRDDFIERAVVVIDVYRASSMMRFDIVDAAKERPVSYHEDRMRQAAAKLDQLVLMRARQIVEEADERRRRVLERFASSKAERIADGSMQARYQGDPE